MHIPQHIYIFCLCKLFTETLSDLNVSFLVSTTPGFRPVGGLFLHICLMFSCTHDFIFIYNRLFLPEIYPETYLRHHLSSLTFSHRTLYTSGILNYHSSEAASSPCSLMSRPLPMFLFLLGMLIS